MDEHEKEIYNKMPGKCKIRFEKLAEILQTSKTPEKDIDKIRRQRIKCWLINKGCKFEQCVYKMPKNRFFGTRCPNCGGSRLTLAGKKIFTCPNCGYTFEYIHLEEVPE